MREILFRGKHRDKDKWLYGVPMKSADIDNTEMLIIESTFECEEYCCKGCNYDPVIPETIGQYTGVFDKNGVEMVEGDIVTGLFKFGMPIKAVVTFKDGSFGLTWYRGEVSTFNAFPCMCNVEYEVIGNIHDNPELLGGIDE